MTPDPISLGLPGRVAAPLAYAGWWVTGALFWFLERRDLFVRFHAAQACVAFGAIAAVVAMLCGWAFALITTRASTPDFWFGVRHYMRDFPMFYALIKGFVFGAVVAFVACHAGLQSRGGSAGVGRSVCLAVIWMIAAIVVFDTALVPLLKVVRI